MDLGRATAPPARSFGAASPGVAASLSAIQTQCRSRLIDAITKGQTCRR